MTTDTSTEAVDPKCEAGCIVYYGGERRHHKDCVFYPESFTQMYDKLLTRAEKAEAERDNQTVKRAAWELAAKQAEAERDALQAEVNRLRSLGLAANAEWGSWVEDQWAGTSLFDEGAEQVEKNRIALEARP